MDELADRRAPITSADASPAELLSVVDAARWLGVSRSSLYRALSAHRIPVTPVNLGGHLRLPRRQLERWLEGDLASDTRPSDAPASAPPAPAARRGELRRRLPPACARRRSHEHEGRATIAGRGRYVASGWQESRAA